ncbi:hypothetical protein SAMN06295905_0008 [Devosia lucknowensis]|uniref:Uncharacterized protein n=1 Tax=Devosia lucknowensis TaxID=1096929 RepID=A0A1Y6E5H4_9HYPH|nr:hypothetical protein [Devosia lucknowensis]SMQ58008.1 hypothetical protein SAMN06295905_0008 [Devosia lucknowensis]
MRKIRVNIANNSSSHSPPNAGKDNSADAADASGTGAERGAEGSTEGLSLEDKQRQAQQQQQQ